MNENEEPEEWSEFKRHGIESEAALVGSILKDPSQYIVLRDDLTHEDIRDIGLSACWRAFESLYERGLSIDQVTVGDELERAGKLQDVDFGGFYGRPAVSKIRDEGRAGNAGSYAVNVLDYSAKRKFLELMNLGASWSMNGRKSVDIQADIIAKASDIKTPNRKADNHVQTLGQAVSSAYDETDAASKGKRAGVETGFVDLDKMLDGGLFAPDFVIVAGRPGQGKTALITNIAYNAACEKKKDGKVIPGKRVAMFVLEMANNQIAMRLIQLVSGVSYGSQRKGEMAEGDWPLYAHAVESLEHLPIYLCDLPAIKPREMKRTLRTLEAKYGKMDLVCVDYLQLQTPDEKHENRNLDIGSISSALKGIAKEFNVPVLAAAQLSRAVESRSSGRPILSDLRESGSQEQDADIVAFIYRPDQYEKDSAKQNVTEIIVAKHRNGPVGSAELIYRSPLTKFENATKRVVVNFDDSRKDIYGD